MGSIPMVIMETHDYALQTQNRLLKSPGSCGKQGKPTVVLMELQTSELTFVSL